MEEWQLRLSLLATTPELAKHLDKEGLSRTSLDQRWARNKAPLSGMEILPGGRALLAFPDSHTGLSCPGFIAAQGCGRMNGSPALFKTLTFHHRIPDQTISQ